MKTLILFLLIPMISLCQLPYSWTTNVNPGWTSSNPTNNTLSWQTSVTTVSTSGFNGGTGNWYTYNNSQVTSYTSPTYDFTGCSTSSMVQVTINLEVNLENRFDWIYFQYSINNGASWVNPVGLSTSTNGSGVNLSAFAPLTAYTNVNSNRNGWTGAVGAIAPSYFIPKTANRFRFIFASDNSVNSYTSGFTTYVYYADILDFTVICPVILPVDLISFSGKNEGTSNLLQWQIGSENTCDHYTIERSITGEDWETIGNYECQGIPMYSAKDETFSNTINYYRLSQIDDNGLTRVYTNEIIAINNRSETVTILRITNLLGQDVEITSPGVVVIQYADGTIEKKFNP